ncbi:hypothetical protein PPERSA_09764 [Pseudocohnilembus persalinus]|uniref:RAP domain-containing protein n=1 Tax=Pseudocohnilembus persalinus TaxID=266149 RepID=A0A0V0QUJ7_PSEPJ|nr:hypothetical protein PPERSA_09764 [Pseudocohnilembus persalinus]|eukprot:KRX05624.1 hypothetical protein PPERSA_09764 [Pseudocohnilembus persalinus]
MENEKNSQNQSQNQLDLQISNQFVQEQEQTFVNIYNFYKAQMYNKLRTYILPNIAQEEKQLQDFDQIIIEVNGPSHYYRDDPHVLKQSSIIKRFFLQIMQMELIQVPYFEYKDFFFTEPKARNQYIQEKLNTAYMEIEDKQYIQKSIIDLLE